MKKLASQRKKYKEKYFKKRSEFSQNKGYQKRNRTMINTNI